MGENRAASEYVLIDFENVQPKNLELLKKHPFKVFVFCGAHQARIPLALASRMQELGTNARYVEMSGNGRNALDFHIAFYLGELAAADPEAQFHIISRDTGFDPLIRHLRDRHIRVQRENDLACVFRSMPATGSEACRPPIPGHAGHPFRMMPGHHSGACRHRECDAG